jgi:hypothetical protein
LCPGLWLYTDDGLLVWREEGRNFRNCLTLVSSMLFCPGLWQFTKEGLLVRGEEGRYFRNCLTLVSYMLCVQDCGSIQRTGFLFGERKMGT